MKTYSVTCTTCQKRLKFRDASAIGEIVICAHCGSMVLVAAPAEWQDEDATATPPAKPAAASSPPHAPPEDGGEHPSAHAPAKPAPRSPAADPPPVDPAPAEPQDEYHALAPPPLPRPREVTPPPTAHPALPARHLHSAHSGSLQDDLPQPEAPPRAEDIAPAGAGWAGVMSDPRQLPALIPDEPVAASRRQGLLIGSAAVLGVVLALGWLSFWAARNTPDVDRTASTGGGSLAPGAAEASDGERDGSPATADAAAADAAAADAAAADAGAADAAESDVPAAADSNGPEDDEPPEEPAAAAVTPEAPDPPGTTAAAGGSSAEGGAATAKPAAADGTPDAAARAAEGGEASTPAAARAAEGGEASTPAAAEATSAGALSHTLEAFAPFIDQPAYASQDDLGGQAGEPDELAAEAPADAGVMAPRPEPRAVDVDQRLKDKIPQLDFPDVPLLSFLRFATAFSTIPISVDPDALALLRVKPQTPIRVQMRDAQMSDVLAAALKPLRLDYVRRGDQLIVTQPPPADGQLRIVRHAVGDLVGDDSRQLEELAELIEAVVEPDSWESLGGPGRLAVEMPGLVIQHQDTVLFRVLLFCERLRAARGLPMTTNLDPELCRLEPAWSLPQAALDRPITIRYAEPTRLLQILDRVSDQSGLQILVDWQALADLGWTPDAETVLAAEQETAGQALQRMLHPMDLTWRAIDVSTIQITSPEALESRWDIEFYELPEAAAPPGDPSPLDRVHQALRQSGVDAAAAVLHLDRPSGRLIAALPQPRQRWLAELLDRWREEH